MTYKKFISGLTPATRCGIFTDYDIEGVLWTGREMETHDTLSCHPEENVILDVRVLDEGKFQWEYSLKIADGVYVRHCVHADNLIDACRAALAYRTTEYLYDWLEETTWYETEPGFLTAVVAGDEARILRLDATRSFDGKTRYNWSRKWAPAAPVLSAINQFSHELSGSADTLELALVAVMEAPGRLTMACAALIATLRKQEPTHA